MPDVLDVLVVDDEPGVRRLLELQLQGLGHHVRTATSVEDALLATAERRPDLLLLDLGLGGRTGEDLVELLDRGLGRPRVVCLVSGLAPQVLAPLAERLGVRFLTKPIRPAALEALLEQAGRAPARAAERPAGRHGAEGTPPDG